MSTRVYTLPVEQTQWHIPGYGAETIFNWEYDEPRDKLLTLYEKGKNNQWNSNTRIEAIARDEAVAVEFDRLRAARDASVRSVIAEG